MKLRDAPFVERSLGDLDEMEFTFVTNGKSFRVLFNTLYPDKPKAIVRELSTNALDAHIAAGCATRPFDVKLPTILDSTFSVRDYGESLTERGMRIYTTVFESTKDDSDDQHGQLGLGSKSPFAYTDSFSVTVWLDGMKRIYLASLNDRGIPTLTEMDRAPSSEPRGVMVSFPVQAKHFSDFKEAAQKVFMGFDVKPNFSGVNPEELKFPKPLYAHGNWQIYEDLDYNAVRMGCVIYRITPDQLKVDTGLRQTYSKKYGVIVDGKIGDFDIAANREALSFDDLTIANVKQCFADFRADVKSYIEGEIGKSPSLLEAERQFVHWSQMMPHSYTLFYRGIKLSGYLEFPDDTVGLPDLRDLSFKRISNTRYGVESLKNMELIVWNSSRTVPRKRARLDEHTMNPSTSYSSRRRRKHMPNTFLLYDPTPETIRFLKKELGIRDDQLKPIESFPDPGPATSSTSVTAVQRASNGKSLMGVYHLPHGGSYLQKVADLQDDFYWMPIPNSKPSEYLRLNHGMGSGRLDQMPKAIAACASEYPMKGYPIYYLTEQAQKRLGATEGTRWDNALAAYIRTNKEAILKQVRAGVVRDQMRSYSDTIILAIGQDPDHYKKRFPKSHIVNSFLSDDYEKARKEGEAQLGVLRAAYPLIFTTTSGEDQDLLQYINFRKGI